MGEFVNISLAVNIPIIREKPILWVDANGKRYLKQL